MDYDLSKILELPIKDLKRAEWNPKSGDYQKVRHSLEVNGLLAPLLVRETDEGYELVDGHQRLKSLEDLGYDKVPVYNLGKISEQEAKRLALWLQVRVPFNEVALAPLAVELKSMGMELPFDDKELEKFESMEAFSMDFGEEEPVDDLGGQMKTLHVRGSPEQVERIRQRISLVQDEENVSEGRGLELLVAEALS